MTRKEYIKFCENRRLTHAKKSVVSDKSVTDPTFAQTGRQMLTNPLPIEYRMKYPEGTPLNKDNPLVFNEFDKLYPDQFKAIREAQSVTSKTRQQLDAIEQHHQQQQQQQQQHTT